MTKKKISILLVTLLLVSFAAVGGIQAARYNARFIPIPLKINIGPPYHFNNQLQELTTYNIKGVKELRSISSGYLSKILRITLSSDGDYLLFVNDNGYLSKWDIFNGQEIESYEIGAVVPAALNFNRDGSRLLVPYMVTDDEKIIGAKIWDTRTGVVLYCNGVKGDCPVDYNWDIAQDGYFLDPTGKWLLGYFIDYESDLNTKRDRAYSLSEVVIHDITNPAPPTDIDGAFELQSLDSDFKYFDDKNAELIALTTDIETQYVAYAFANGVVRIRTVHDPIPLSTTVSPYQLDYQQVLQKERVNVTDIQIDDTRTWLATLTDKYLVVWNLQRGSFFPLKIKSNINDGIALSFDHTGRLLFVAAKDKIIAYNLSSGKAITTISTNQISSLYVSRDNRSLIWGDNTGIIHLFGIEE